MWMLNLCELSTIKMFIQTIMWVNFQNFRLHNFEFRERLIRTGRSVFGDISPVHSLWEHRRVVVDVFQIHLDVGVTDQTFTAFVLCENGEPPLWSTVGLIPVQRLWG